MPANGTDLYECPQCGHRAFQWEETMSVTGQIHGDGVDQYPSPDRTRELVRDSISDTGVVCADCGTRHYALDELKPVVEFDEEVQLSDINRDD